MTSWWKSISKDNSAVSGNKLKKLLTPVEGGININSHLGERPRRKQSNINPTKERIMAEKNMVNMEDGTVETFGAKQKMIKNSLTNEAGITQTTLKFSNGRVITFDMPDELKNRFAEHGADQKFGDVIAGVQDIDDCVLAVEDLASRLSKGEWSMKREGNSFSGTSVLLQALVAKTGKSVDEVKAFLGTKSHAEKAALRANPAVRPFIEEIETARAAKSGQKINTDALLEELA